MGVNGKILKSWKINLDHHKAKRTKITSLITIYVSIMCHLKFVLFHSYHSPKSVVFHHNSQLYEQLFTCSL